MCPRLCYILVSVFTRFKGPHPDLWNIPLTLDIIRWTRGIALGTFPGVLASEGLINFSVAIERFDTTQLQQSFFCRNLAYDLLREKLHASMLEGSL